MRYNINNKPISVVKCSTCGHEVDISEIEYAHVNGTEVEWGIALVCANALARCCADPYYQRLKE